MNLTAGPSRSSQQSSWSNVKEAQLVCLHFPPFLLLRAVFLQFGALSLQERRAVFPAPGWLGLQHLWNGCQLISQAQEATANLDLILQTHTRGSQSSKQT